MTKVATALFIAGVLLVTGGPLWAATPALVQHVAAPNTGTNLGTTAFNFQLPNPSLSGNLLIVAVTWAATTSGVTLPASGIRDNKGQTWSLVATANGSTGFQSAAMFYKAGTAAGVTTITAMFSGGTPNFVSGVASEWYNVAVSPTVHSGTAESTFSTSSWSTSSFTPSNGDLVYQFAAGNGDSADVASFAAQSGFTLASAQCTETAQATQYGIGTGSLMTPTITAGTSSAGYISVAGSFTSASAGQAPTATPRIVRIQHNQLANNASPVQDQFPSSGNLIVIMSSDDSFNNAVTITPTDSNGNAYTQISGSPISNGAGGQIQGFYAANATTGSTMATTLTYTVGSGGNQGADVVYYDIIGAATNPFVASNATSNTKSSPGNLTSVTIPPSGNFSQSGLLVLAHIDHDTGNETGTAADANGHTPLFTQPWTSNDDGNFAGTFTLDSGEATILTADSLAVTFVWTRSATAPGSWVALAMAFKAPPRGATPAAPTNLQIR